MEVHYGRREWIRIFIQFRKRSSEKDNLIEVNRDELLNFRLIRDFHLQKILEKDEKSKIVNTIKNLHI